MKPGPLHGLFPALKNSFDLQCVTLKEKKKILSLNVKSEVAKNKTFKCIERGPLSQGNHVFVFIAAFM